MSAAEFEAVCPLLKISEDRLTAVRAALVDGQTFQAIGERFGWTRQAVNNAVRDVWRVVERYRQSQHAAENAAASLPPGWERVTLISPSHLVPNFREAIAQASSQPSKTVKPQRTDKKQEIKKPGA